MTANVFAKVVNGTIISDFALSEESRAYLSRQLDSQRCAAT